MKKMRSLVQVFEDQAMEISPYIYGNYKYGKLVWKVWNTSMESVEHLYGKYGHLYKF